MKMTCDERTTAMEMVNILVNAGIAAALNDDKAKYGLYDWYRNTSLRDNGISYADGATKCVFIDHVFNWVIKVNLPGNDARDYCAREYENYCLAEELGFDYYLAACEYLDEVDGVKFYAQQYATCDEEVDSEIYERLCEKYASEGIEYDVDTVMDEVDSLDGYDRIMTLYGDDQFAAFIADRRINDLHCGNFGVMGDHYVIIDYSGFSSF